ncbi:hypothetical protein [Saccharothrix deserti]|uniref:hypothetical protein n=1 Tax=Saccharothrix deserti TaxID=2593674 RepID=UPI00131E32E2|nr:hypothetical protein [Saccharothrix deserti]
MTATPARAPIRHYRLLAGLYVGQWLAPSFLGSGGLLTILYDRGVSLEQLGVFQALILVGLAKVLWSPLVDRFGSTRFGHYRSWLLVAQPAMVLAVLVLLPLDPVGDLGVVVVITVVMWVLMGTQDVATDALAFRLLDRTGRGVANGIQTAAGFASSLRRPQAAHHHAGHTGNRVIIADLEVREEFESDPSGFMVERHGDAWREGPQRLGADEQVFGWPLMETSPLKARLEDGDLGQVFTEPDAW